MPTLLRNARPAEHDALTELTIRSKAHWGYDRAFIDLFRGELTISADQIRDDHVTVLEVDGRLAGYVQLRPQEPGTVELVSLFIDPWAIRKGYGRQLWNHTAEWTRSAGYRQLVLESDPHAEGFYRRLGAIEIRRQDSITKPGRSLAIMVFPLTGDA